MSVADAITLMLMFGGFILSFIGLIVIIIQAIIGKKKKTASKLLGGGLAV